MRRFVLVTLLLCACATSADRRTNVRIVTDEADAVLAILDARAANGQVSEAQWNRVFASEGYVRLRKREHSMGRAFEDETFRQFVMSPELLARRDSLHRALDKMKRADLSTAAGRAAAYLPANATITAAIYPVIKPRENSFVFEGEAIFKYLEEEPVERFEETIAHELHHIGYGTACSHEDATATPQERLLQKWVGAFGEGFAVLAAAGGPDGVPSGHAAPDVRAEWAKGVANHAAEFARVERFFTDVLDERIAGDEADKKAFEFFGVVGPWYTVGWKMAMTIEAEFGRQELIRAFCERHTLLATYNRAAEAHQKRTGEQLPRWSERVLAAFQR